MYSRCGNHVDGAAGIMRSKSGERPAFRDTDATGWITNPALSPKTGTQIHEWFFKYEIRESRDEKNGNEPSGERHPWGAVQPEDFWVATKELLPNINGIRKNTDLPNDHPIQRPEALRDCNAGEKEHAKTKGLKRRS